MIERRRLFDDLRGVDGIEADDVLAGVSEDFAAEAGEVFGDATGGTTMGVKGEKVPGEEAGVDPGELLVLLLFVLAMTV